MFPAAARSKTAAVSAARWRIFHPQGHGASRDPFSGSPGLRQSSPPPPAPASRARYADLATKAPLLINPSVQVGSAPIPVLMVIYGVAVARAAPYLLHQNSGIGIILSKAGQLQQSCKSLRNGTGHASQVRASVTPSSKSNGAACRRQARQGGGSVSCSARESAISPPNHSSGVASAG